MTATVILSALVVTVVLLWGVLITVLFSRSLESAFLNARRMHERQSKQIDQLLDRFMAMDFDRFKSHQSAEESQPGEFVAPEDQRRDLDDTVVQIYPSWGSLDRTAAMMEALENEQTLVQEDFPDENR